MVLLFLLLILVSVNSKGRFETDIRDLIFKILEDKFLVLRPFLHFMSKAFQPKKRPKLKLGDGLNGFKCLIYNLRFMKFAFSLTP